MNSDEQRKLDELSFGLKPETNSVTEGRSNQANRVFPIVPVMKILTAAWIANQARIRRKL